MEKQKEYNLRSLLSVLHEEKRRTGSDSGRTNATKTASDVFRHWSKTGKSYCRTRYNIEWERIKKNTNAKWYYVAWLKQTCNLAGMFWKKSRWKETAIQWFQSYCTVLVIQESCLLLVLQFVGMCTDLIQRATYIYIYIRQYTACGISDVWRGYYVCWS
jgi:hypothetical protein